MSDLAPTGMSPGADRSAPLPPTAESPNGATVQPQGATASAGEVRYTVNLRALQRWARDRLQLIRQPDGGTEARFRFDGTTCSNLGQPLAFDHVIRLGPPTTGYIIWQAACRPAAGDTGHTKMCAYLTDGPALLEAIGEERSLLGRPLNDVLPGLRSPVPAGCYCHAESRAHQWALALETVHYALAHPSPAVPATPSAS